MNPKNIYDEILSYISTINSIEILASEFYEENFGNFVVDFSKYGKKFRLFNDRGQVIFEELGDHDSQETLFYINSDGNESTSIEICLSRIRLS